MSHSVRENRHGNLCWELCWAQRAVCLSARPSFWPHGLVLPQQEKKKKHRETVCFFSVEIFPALPASPSWLFPVEMWGRGGAAEDGGGGMWGRLCPGGAHPRDAPRKGGAQHLTSPSPPQLAGGAQRPAAVSQRASQFLFGSRGALPLLRPHPTGGERRSIA